MRYYERGKLLIENRRNCAEFESLRAFKHLDEISGEIVRNFSDISKDEKIGKRERERVKLYETGDVFEIFIGAINVNNGRGTNFNRNVETMGTGKGQLIGQLVDFRYVGYKMRFQCGFIHFHPRTGIHGVMNIVITKVNIFPSVKCVHKLLLPAS